MMNIHRKMVRACSVLLGMVLTVQAQTNFVWTNAVGGNWNSAGNWTNESSGTQPLTGGASSYILSFETPVLPVIATNDLGSAGANGFQLNQLNFGNAPVTLYGSNMVFLTGQNLALPALNQNGAGAITLNVGVALSNSTTFSGTGTGALTLNSSVVGAGSLVMGGNYALTLNASNGYGGGTTISKGTLRVGNAFALGTNRAVVVNGTGTLDLNSVDLRTNYVYNVVISGAGFTNGGAVVNNGLADLTNLGLDNLTLAGDATIGGTKRWGVQNGVDLAGFRLTKVGVNQVSFNAGTVTAGNMDLNAGILSLEGGGINVASGGVITLNTGGSLMLYGTAASNITRSLVANGGTLMLGSGGAGGGAANSPIVLQSNLTLNVGGAYVLNGVISEAGGSYALVKTGTANLMLTAANTYSGGTTNSSGWLIVSNSNALGTGQLVMNGGTLSNALNGATYANVISLQAAGTIQTPIGSVTTFTGPITNTGALTIYGGTTNALGMGTVYVLGTNTFTGNMNINNGVVVINNSQGLGTGTKTVTINRNTNFDPQLVLDGSAGPITLAGGLSFATSQANYPTVSNAAGNNVINGKFDLQGGGGSTWLEVGSGTLTMNGNFSPSTTTRTLILGGVGTGYVFGVVSDGAGANTLNGFVKQGSGLWVIGANNSFFGATNGAGTVINGGTLQVGNGGAVGTLGTASVSVASGATLAFSRSDIFMASNSISGAGQVVFNGPGYLTLSATTNSYTGGTVVNGGTLGFASQAAIGGAGPNINNNVGGALAVAGAYTNVAGWLASGHVAINSGGAMALTANSAETVNFGVYSNLYLGAASGNNATYSGSYIVTNSNMYRLGGGGGTLTYASALTGDTTLVVGGGVGTVVLTASNSFSGGMIVSNGAFAAPANNHAVGTGGVIVYGLNDGAGSGLALANNITLTNALTLVGTAGGTARAGNASGVNTLSGPIEINSAAGLASFDANGGFLTISGSITGGDFTVRGAAAGAITGGIDIPGTLSKAEAGQWTIGAVGPVYSWSNLAVQAGTLRLGAGNMLPATSLVTMGATSDVSAALLDLNGFDQTVAGVTSGAGSSGAKVIGNSAGAGATFTVSNSDNYVFLGGFGGNLSLVKEGPGLLSIGNSAHTGSTLINSGMLQLGTNGAFGSLGLGPVTNSGVLAFNRSDSYTVFSSITGPGVLLQMGNGVTLLSGQNTFTGGLLITNGEAGAVLDSGWGAAGNLISVSGGALAVNGTTIQSMGPHPLNAGTFNGGVDVFSPYGAFVIATNLSGGSSLTKLGKGVLILQGTNTYNGGTTVSNGTLRLLAGGGDNLLAADGALNLVGGTLDLAGSSQTTTSLVLQGGSVQNGSLTVATSNLVLSAGMAAAALNLQGSAPLVKIGSGYLALLGNNTYSGATVLSNGTLAIVSDANIGGSSGSTITFAGGILGILGNALPNLDGHDVNYNTFNGGFDIATPGVAFTLTNAISDGGSLTKAGLGTLVLAVANSYSGPTIINAGTLQVDNGGATGTLGSGIVTNNASLVFFRSDSYGVTNNIVGTGATTVRSGVLNYGVGGITNGRLFVADTPGLNATFNLTSGVVRITQTANNQFIIGNAPNALGTFNMSGGLLTSSNELWIAGGVSNSRGFFNLTGGSVVVSNWTAVGRGAANGSVGNYGELNISGGAWSNQANNGMTIASYGGNTGRVTVTGGSLYVQNALYVGEGNGAVATAPAVGMMVIGGGTVYAGNSLMVGQSAAGIGALIQTGGVLNVAAGEFDMGNANALNYGFYMNAGGIASNANWMQAGRGGMGVIYLVGGTNFINASSQGLLAGMSGSGSSTGVIYIAGGTLRDTGRLGVGWAGSSRAEVTIGGNSSVIIGSGGVEFNQANTTMSFLNLNGGTLSTLNVYKNVAGGWSVLNLNGGTLLAQGNQTFMGPGAGGVGALDAAYVYGTGALIDSSNFNITISQNLLSPTGQGVTSIPWSGSMVGYVGAPYVAISGGGGTGATAIAQFDFTSGSVTGILLTSAGVGYTSTPTVALVGGGIASNYLGIAFIGANNAGAVTKQGGGALLLTGTNTYAGGSVINNGLLVFASTNAIGSGFVTINNGGALGVTGSYGSASAWLDSGRIATNSTGALALGAANAAEDINFMTAAGGVYSNLYVGALSPVLYSGALSFYNNDYRLGGGGSTLALTNDLAGNTLNIGLPGTSVTNTVALNGFLSFVGGIVVNSNAVLSLAGPALGTISLTNATVQVRGAAVNSLALNPALAGSVTFDINTAGHTVTLGDNLTAGGPFTKAGSGVLALGGANSFSSNVTVAAGALRITSSDALNGTGSNVTVASGAALQLQGGITPAADDLLTLNGAGVANDGALRNIAGSNTWAGPITLGSASRVNTDAGLLTLSGRITNGTNLLTVGGVANTVISGPILGGTGGLTKDGSGILTLTGSNLYTGTTTISAGGLVLDFSQPGAPLNNIINNTALAMGYNVLGTNASLLVIGQGAGVTTQSFNGVTLNPGNNSIVASNFNGGGTTVLRLGTVTRATGGGLLDLTLPGGNGRITTTSATNTVGIFDAWVTVNKQDWAALNGTSFTAFTNYTLVDPFLRVIPSLNTYAVKVTSGVGVTNFLGVDPTSIKTLLVNDPTKNHVIVMSGQTLRMGSPGAIMLASGSGGLTVGTNVNDGFLTAGSDLTLINYSTNTLVINSSYTNGSSLTINGGGPVVFNGITASAGATYLNNGAVRFNNQNTLTGAVNIRGGTVTLSGTSFNTLGAVTLQDSSTLNLNGPTTLGTNSMIVGSLAGDRATVVIGANATMAKLLVGTVSGAAGAVVQNSGAVLAGPGVGGVDVLSLGNGGYGYYQLNGGTLLSGQFAPGGSAAGGTGVFDQYGGATTVNGQWFILGWGGTSRGVVNLFNGTMSFVTNQQPLTLGYTGNTNFGAINLLGSSVVFDTTGGTNGLPVEMMRTAGNSTSVINLNSGTLEANQIKASTAGLSLLNFNGGTLQVNASSVFSNTFLTGLTAATIYSGGATLDTTNNASVTIPQNLTGPTGFGLTGIALANNGAGYIGAPVVVLTGGNGTGATAIAQVDLGSGQVTNLLITSAGSGYLPTDALTVQLLGGGFTRAATPGTYRWAANVNSGSLTVNGGGVLTLTGTNSYGGTSIVNSGSLVFQPALLTTNKVGGLGGEGAVVQNGPGVTILGGDSSTFAGSATINTGTLQFATLNSLPTHALGGVLVTNQGVAALGFTGIEGAKSLTNFNTTSPGIIAFMPVSGTDTFNFAGAGLSNAFFGGLTSATFGGTYTPYNNAYQLTGIRGNALTFTNAIGGSSSVSIGTGFGVSSGLVVFTAANNTYSGPTVIAPNSTLQAGAANVIGSQSAVTLSNGAVFNVAGFNQSLGSLAGLGSIINTNAKMTLTVGDNGASTLFGGTISGSQDLVKAGSGILNLTNSNFYTGSTIVNGGTLQLAPAQTNYAGLWETYTNVASVWAPVGMTKLTTTSYPRFAETNLASIVGTPAWPSNAPQNATMGYLGYVYNNAGSNATWTFAANIDDGSQLLIDGRLVLSSAGNATVMTNITLSPGAHSIDYRIQNGTGGYGTYGLFGSGTGIGTGGSIGFGYDPLGRGQAVAGNYVIPADPGNGTFFTTAAGVLPAATPLYIATGATVDLNGAVQNIAMLSDYAGGGGLVTNTALAANAVLQIATLAGSNTTFSGNISDASESNNISLWIGGSGTQVLAGTNSYHGGTVISGGVLQFAQTSAISPYSNVLINAGGTLANAGAYINVNDWLNSGSIASNSAGSLAFTTAANLSEAVNLALAGGGQYSNLYLGAIGNITFNGTVIPAAGITRLGGGGGKLTIANPLVSGSVAIGGGLGTVVLSNTLNTYTSTVLNAGILQVTADAALGTATAGQTNITFALGGTLQAGAPTVVLAATRTLLVTNGVLGTLDNNGNSFTINGNIVGTGTLVSTGAGTNTLGGLANTVQGIQARNGTLIFAPGSSNNIAGGNSTNIYGLQVAPVTGDRAIVRFNPTAGQTNIILGTLRVGNGTNSAGVVYQTSGLVLQNGGNANQDFAIGSGGGYGYYKLTGGTVVGNQMEISSVNTGAGGVGVMDILGGTVSPQQYFMIGRSANGIGVVTVANGGVLNGAVNNTAGIAFGWDGSANGYGVLNILNGGLVNAGIGGKTLDLGANSGTNTGIVNLNLGGTAIVSQITRSQVGTGILNFNGGLLIASNNANATLINSNLSGAYVYQGGFNISNNVNSAVLQPLLAPTGYGVSGIGLADGGTNYLGVPALLITGGNGTGATAIAQINAAGVITNILVTNYGVGYLPGDVLTVQVLGGGASINGLPGVVTLGANASGGLVKTGPGILTLGGNNTYTDLTTIVAGHLQLGSGGTSGSLANPNVVFSNTASWLGFNHSDTITNSLVLQTPNGKLAAIVQNGSGMLVLTNTVQQFNAAAISNGLMFFASAAAVPTNATGRNSITLATGGGVLVTNLYGSINGWLNSGMITNIPGGGMLALTTGVNTENVNWVAANGTVYSNQYIGVAPGHVATFLGSLTPVGTNYLVGGGGGTLVIGNVNAFSDANALTNRSVAFGAGGPTGAVYVVGPQNYTGGTTLTNTMVSISADNNLGYGNLTINSGGVLQIMNAPNFATVKQLAFNANGTINLGLDIATGSTATLFGAVSVTGNGSQQFYKWGGGTLIFNGNNVTVGATGQRWAFSAGTTIVDSNAVVNSASSFQIVGYNNGDNAALLLRNNGVYITSGNGANNLILADAVGSAGTMTVQDNAQFLQNGGGGTYIGNGGTGMLTVNGGNVLLGATVLGFAASGVGTINVNGGSLSVGNLTIGNATGALATNNLNGGVELIRGTYITKVGGTAVFNFNGGTLRAGNNFVFSNLFNVATLNGFSTLDSSNFTVTLNQAFTGTGSLTKQGSGTLLVNSPSNTFANIQDNAGQIQFAATSGMTPGRTLTINAGAAAGYSSANANGLDQGFLLRVASNSVGTVALGSNSTSNLDFSLAGANLTNVSLGAIGTTPWTYSGVLTNFGSTYRLGGGGGTLVITNNLTPGPGTNLVAFGNGGQGTLILTGTNTWTSTTVSGGVVRYGSTNAMGLNVTVASGGAIANNGALDTNLFAQLNTGSAGAFVFVANNTNPVAGNINLGAYPNLSIGAAGGSWTNDGAILPYGTTYQLGGGGGTLVLTNSALNGAGTNLVAFSGSNAGTLVLAGTNTFDGGTTIGALGNVIATTMGLGTGAATNNGTLTFNMTSTAGATTNGVLQNLLSGTGNLVLNNQMHATQLIITNSNPFSGPVYINSGMLSLSNQTSGQTSLASTSINLGNGISNAWLRLYANQQLNPAAILNVTGGTANSKFEMNGFTQTVAAINSAGALAIIQNMEVGGSGSGLLIVSNDTVNSLWAGYMRNMTGTLALNKAGAAQLTLVGNQIAYTGATVVNGGTLLLSNTTIFASPVTVNGGQLLLATPGNTTVMSQMVTNNANNGLGFSGGTTFSIGGLAGNGSITLWSQTGGGVTLNVGGGNSNTTYSGSLADVGPGNYYQGNLVKTGSGTLTLTGTNTYHGYTLLNAGILQADAGLGLSPYANVNFNGGSLASVPGLITNAVGLGAGQFNILNGGFSAVGTPTIVSLGGVGSPSGLAWGTPSFSPTTFMLNETNANNTLTLLNNIDLFGNNAAVGANATNPNALAVISGVISDSLGTGSLIKRGGGTLVLAGANTYTNGTFIAGGNLAMTNDLLGVPGTPLFLTNNGAFEASGNFTLNNRAVLVQTGGGKINVDAGLTLTITNNILAAGGALTKVGSGTLLLTAGPTRSQLTNGLNANAGVLLMTNNNLWLNNSAANIGQNVGDAGTVILGDNAVWASTNMPNGTGGPILAVGNAGRGTLIIQGNANITNRLYVGNAAGSAGAVYQRSGTSVWWNGTASDGKMGVNGYGYYELAGGSMMQAGFSQIGANLTGVGVVAQLGGSFVQQTTLGGQLALSRGGVGVYNLLGGTFVSSNTVNLGEASDNALTNGVAIFNMLGGSARVVGNMSMANRTNMTMAAINLDGGVLTVNQIQRGVTSNSPTFVNFNGGTLQARQNGALFGTGTAAPDGTYIYANGGTLDASNFMVSVPVNLQAPQGQGVTSISLGAPTLAGYVGSPYVQISGGGGTGATAYAQFDSAQGLVTGIVMTSYGYGYTADPTVTLLGNTTNSLGTMTRAANTSGSLTVNGTTNGVLFLSGVNTYAGGTIVNGGNLLFTGASALPASGNVLVNFAGSLGVTNASSPFTSAAAWLTSGRISTLSTGTLSLAYNSAAGETLDFNAMGFDSLSLGAVAGMTVTNSANIVPNSLTYRLGGGWGTLVITNNLLLGNSLNAFGSGSGGKLILGGSNYFPNGVTINPIGVVQANSPYALGGMTNIVVPYGATLANGFAMDNAFLGTISSLSSGTLALAASTPNPLDFNTPGLPSVSLGAVGTVTNNSSLITPYAGVYRLGGGWGTLVLTNNGLTGAGRSVVAFDSGSGGSLVLGGTNDYAGGTWIGALGTAAVSTVSLGSGAVTNNGVLMFSQTASGTNANSIGGTGVLMFTNTGLIALTGLNTYSGGTVVTTNSWLHINTPNALGVGSLTLTNSGLLQFSGGLTITNAVTIYGGDGAGKQSNFRGSLQSTNGNNVWAGLITLSTGSGRVDVESDQLRVVGGVAGTSSLILQPQTGANLIVDTTPILLPGQTVTFTGGGTNWLNVGSNNFANANFNFGSTVLKLGLDNALPTGVNMTIGGNNSGDTSSPQFWLNGYNQTISNLTVACSNQISLNTINVGTNTLTVNGNMTVGSTLSNSTTRLAVTGSGALIVNKVGGIIQIGNNSADNGNTVGNQGNRATNDMSALGTFVANLGSTGRFIIGDPNVQGNAQNDAGDRSTVILATNSTIVAGALNIGDNNQFSSLQTLRLGAGVNIINASTVTVGAAMGGRSYGLLQFNGATGSLALSNTVGGRAEMVVASSTPGVSTGAAITGTVNLVSHPVDLYLGDLLLGNALPTALGNNSGDRLGFFSFDSGTLDVTNILMGSRAGTVIVNANSSYGYLTISGGVARIGQIAMATNYNWFVSAGSNNSGKANAYVNLLGGSVTVSNGITRGLGGGSNGIAQVNLAGASLDMNGSAIGGAGLLYGVSFNASNGVLQNLGQLNGGTTPLVKAGNGTLLVLGNNTYSGGTLVSAGLLQLGDGVANNGSVQGPITNNAQLAFANPFDQTFGGIVSGPGSLTKSGSGQLTLSAMNTFTGATTNNAGTLRLGDGVAHNGTVGGNIVNNSTLQFANPKAQTFGGTISGSGGLVKTGAGVLTLAAVNSYAGNTFISNGTVRLGLANALPATAVAAGPAGTLDLAGFNQVLTGVDGYQGVITNSSVASTLTVSLSTTQNFGGTLAGPANFTLQGGGQLNLSGHTSASYSGNVLVSNATLMVSGSLTTGGLIGVYNGGTVGGTGQLGAVQVYSGGIYSPGLSGPGAQLAHSLTLDGGQFRSEIVTTNNFGHLTLTSGLTLVTGTTNYLHLALQNYMLQDGASYLLVQDDSSTPWNGSVFTLDDPLGPNNGLVLTNGTTFLALGGAAGTNTFTLAYDFDSISGTTGSGNDLLLQLVPAPAPANLQPLSSAAPPSDSPEAASAGLQALSGAAPLNVIPEPAPVQLLLIFGAAYCVRRCLGRKHSHSDKGTQI